METVFTISGAAPYELGADAPPVDVTQSDYLCALQVRPLLVTGGVAALGGVGATVFGIYKFGQKRVGAGFGSIAAAVGLWWLGGRLLRSAASSFQVCRQPR